MKKIIVDNCPACDPINRLIEILINKGCVLLEEKIQDYHFHQLYFKIKGEHKVINDLDLIDFSVADNKIICNCHWSTIEIVVPPNT